MSVNKILIFVICALVAVVLFMLISYANIKSELTAKEYELASLTLKLESQNAHIKALELDSQTYQETKPKIQEKIITKYVAQPPPTPQDNASCEARLLHIQNQIALWYGIPNLNAKDR